MEKLLLLFLKKDVFVSKKQAEESIGTADSPPPHVPVPCNKCSATKNIPRSRPGPATFDRHRLTIDSIPFPARNETKLCPTSTHGLRLRFHSSLLHEKREISSSFGPVRDMPTRTGDRQRLLNQGKKDHSGLFVTNESCHATSSSSNLRNVGAELEGTTLACNRHQHGHGTVIR
jgi:hypothetical protein